MAERGLGFVGTQGGQGKPCLGLALLFLKSQGFCEPSCAFACVMGLTRAMRCSWLLLDAARCHQFLLLHFGKGSLGSESTVGCVDRENTPLFCGCWHWRVALIRSSFAVPWLSLDC